MNTAQIQAYVQEFMHTNDPETIGQIPTFVANAASRIASEFRNSILDLNFVGVAIESQALPDDFIAAKLVLADGYALAWLPADQFADAVKLGSDSLPAPGRPAYFTIIGNMLSVYPLPQTSVYMEYLGLNKENPDIIATQLPAMLVQGAVAEGQKFEGDLESAENALQDFYLQLQKAKGWEIPGPLSLGGVR